jgi:hypothetical protein
LLKSGPKTNSIIDAGDLLRSADDFKNGGVKILDTPPYPEVLLYRGKNVGVRLDGAVGAPTPT